MAATDSNPKPEAHAFSAQRFQDGQRGGKGEIAKCSHCKREGHTSDKCWVLHPHLKPKKFTDSAKKREGSRTLELKDEKMAFASSKEEEIKGSHVNSDARLERVEKNACVSSGPNFWRMFI
jgi:hypothetical protein